MFADLGRWSSSDPSQQGPDDTFIFLYSPATAFTPPFSGNVGAPITLDFNTTNSLDGGFSFNGKDNITLQNFRVPSASVTPGLILFGTGTSVISENCIVRNGLSEDKTGSSLIRLSYSAGAIIENMTVTNFLGNGISGDTSITNAIIRNNIFVESSAGSSSEIDIIKLGWAERVLIEGNLLVMRASKSGGDPHNDILQCWHNFSDTTKKPRDWTVRNNWMEIDSCTGSGAFVNFCMFQNMAGTFEITGNVFYSHNLATTIGLGVNFEYYNDTFDLLMVNNTFISSSNGLANQIMIRPGTATPKTAYLVNNIFYRDSDSSSPVSEEITSLDADLLYSEGNYVIGGAGFMKRFDYTTKAFIGTVTTLEGRLLATRTATEPIANVFPQVSDYNFSPTTDYLADTLSGVPLTETVLLLNSAVRSEFPDPTTTEAAETPSSSGASESIPAAPTISAISNQSMQRNGEPLVVGFVVGDDLDDPGDLTVTAESSNEALVTVATGGSGANRTVTLTAQPDQEGTATITVTAEDSGELTTDEEFTVTILNRAFDLDGDFSVSGAAVLN